MSFKGEVILIVNCGGVVSEKTFLKYLERINGIADDMFDGRVGIKDVMDEFSFIHNYTSKKERYSTRPTFNDIYWIVDESKIYGLTLFYCTDRGNADTAKNYLNSMDHHIYDLTKKNKKLSDDLEKVHKTILNSYANEKTEMGKSILKQLMETLEL